MKNGLKQEGRPRLGAPLRVMHIVPRLFRGGMEHNVVKLVNGLDPGSIQSSICSLLPADHLKDLLKPTVPLHEFERRTGNDPLIPLRLARLFRRERIDIVHSHGWGVLCETFLAAMLARVPRWIHGEHGTMELKPRNLPIQRWVWGRADQVLSVCAAHAQRMSAATGFPVSGIEVIRNGVDPVRFSPANADDLRIELGIQPSEIVIGTVGRLEPVKDQGLFLKAVATVARARAAVRAVIVGEGPLLVGLTAKASELGIADRVLFLGPRADVERVLAAMDIFVLSSKSEGLPNTVMEAMAAGIPVVSTSVGGAPELVQDGVSGVLVPKEDPAAMSHALATLVADQPLRERMGQAGRARVVHDLTLQHMLTLYAGLYVRLGAGGSGHV